MAIKDSAKTILCYGDSNTWGADPVKDERYPRSVRWTTILADELGSDFEVISEGLCGRTLVAKDPKKPYRTGITHLRAILQTHDPVDLVIIMLGTNDVKNTYNLSASEIANHLEQTIEIIKSDDELHQFPKILVICPPSPIKPEEGELDPRMSRGPEIFKELPSLFNEVSKKYGCYYLDAGKIISSGTVDGYHLSPESHQKLATTIGEMIHDILK